MISKPSSIDLFLENVLFIRNEQEQWRRREETSSSRSAKKKTTDISQRLYSLHHKGTLKISAARALAMQKIDVPSETSRVEPRDPTNNQLASYLHGVSKLRDELMRTNENRSNSYTLPQDPAYRHLALHKKGVSKLRNELKQCKSLDIPSSMGIVKIPSTSRVHPQFSKLFIDNLGRKLEEALEKRQHLISIEIPMQVKKNTDVKNGQHLLEIGLRLAVEWQLQLEWKVLKKKKALSCDESEVLHRDDVKISERSMAMKELPSIKELPIAEERECVEYHNHAITN